MARQFALALSLALVAAVSGHEHLYAECVLGQDICPDGTCTIDVGDPLAPAITVQSSVVNCDSACDSELGCEFFTYHTITQVCTLKHSGAASFPDIPRTADASVISGWVGCTSRDSRTPAWSAWESVLCIARSRFRYCEGPPPIGSEAACPEGGNTEIIEECTRTDCDKPEVHTAMSGYINTPLYGGHGSYPFNVNCLTLINIEGAANITLSFNEFDLQDSVDCASDYLAIYNGPSVEFPMLGKFCGTTVPADQVATGSSMLIMFVTDSSVERMGFGASYTSEM